MTLKSWLRRRLGGDIDLARIVQLKRQMRALREQLTAARVEARRVGNVSRQAGARLQARVDKMSRQAGKAARNATDDRERLERSTLASG